MTIKKLIFAAYGVAILGVFLPWYSAFGVSVPGTETDDGKIVLGFAAVGALVWGLRRVRVIRWRVWQLLAFGVISLAYIDSQNVGVGVGIGLTLDIVAGLAGLGDARRVVIRPRSPKISRGAKR